MDHQNTIGHEPVNLLSPTIALLERVVGAITNVAMAVSAAGVLLCLALITYSVVMRYAFNSPPAWVDDTVGFTLAGIVMLAAASTLRQGGHIGVDILTAGLGARGKRWAEAWAMLTVLAVSLILIVNGWETVIFSRMLGIMSAGNVEIPVYLLQLLIPLGGVMMLLVALEALIRLAAGASPPATHAHHIEDAE